MTLLTRTGKGSALTQAEMDANLAEIGVKGADIVAAATTDLATVVGNQVNVTGNTGITGFGATAPIGTIRILTFTGTPLITHSASVPGIILPGGVNWQAGAGDTLIFQHRGSGQWRCIGFLASDNRLIGIKYTTYQAVYDNGSTPGATPTINLNNGRYQKVTLSANITALTLTPPPGPGEFHIDIYQPAAGGPWTLTMPASLKWDSRKLSSDKILSTAASARDRLILAYNGTDYIADLIKGVA